MKYAFLVLCLTAPLSAYGEKGRSIEGFKCSGGPAEYHRMKYMVENNNCFVPRCFASVRLGE